MGEDLSAGKVSLKVEGNTKGFGADVAKGIEAESGFLSHVGHKLKDTLLAGFGALGIGVAVGEYIKSGIEEYTNFDAMNAQFAAGIKSTGNSAHLTVEQMDKLAASVAGYSGQSEQSIGKTEQVLQTFTAIKNVGPHKIFDQATVAAANMAAKLGGDASGSAIQLGKALQDPVRGMTALRRVGVSFTQTQQDAIKADVARGDSLSAQKVILKELNTEFGGAAKAAGQTFPGQIARAKVAMGELNKALVMAVLPVLTPLIGALADKIQALVPKVEEATSAFREKFLPGLEGVRKTFGLVMQLLQGNDSIKFKKIDLGPWTKPLILAGDIIRAVFGAIKGLVGNAFDAIGKGAGPTNSSLANLALAFLKLIQQLSPLGLLLKGLGPALPGIAKALAQLLDSVTPLVNMTSKFVVWLLRLITPLLKMPGVLGTLIGLFVAWKLAMAGAAAYAKFEAFGKGIKDVSTKFQAFYSFWFKKNTEQTVAEEKGAAKSVAVRAAALVKTMAFKAKDLAQTIAIQAMYAKDAVVQAAKTTAAWVGSTVKTTAAWVATKAKVVASFVATTAGAVAQGAKAAAVWVAGAVKSSAAWVIANAKIIAGWVAQTAVAVANGARQAAVWLLINGRTLAYIAIQGILKGAQMAATAAQWLFNAAMDANPIGIIVVAIAALVAGLIWFFTQTKLGKAIWQDIVAFLTDAWKGLVAVATVVWNAILDAVTTAINVVKAVINTVVGWITAYWRLSIEMWHAIITAVFNAIKAVVTTVINVVKAIINTVISWITGFWRTQVNGWHVIITTVFNAIKAVVNAVINTVQSIISGAISFVTGVWTTGWNLIFSTAKGILTNVVNAVSTAVGNVIKFFSSIGSKIQTAIGDAGKILLDIGTNIVQGLINGIKGAWSLVTGAISGLVNLIPAGVRKILGIHSPSTVFRSIGLYLGQGLQKGIEGSQAGVKSAMTTLTDKVITTFDSLVKQRTAAQKRLATLDREYANVTGLTAAAKRRRALLESEIADEKHTVAELTKESSRSTESTVLKLLKADNVKLTAEAAKRDGIAARLKTATANAAAALKTQTDYAASVRDNVLQSGSVIGVTQADGTTPGTATDIIAKLQKAVADTETFATDLKTLRKMGLDDTTFKQLLDAGVSGGGLAAAQALLSGGQAQVAQVASLQRQLASTATSLGKQGADQLYGAATASAEGLVKGLKASEAKVTSQMELLGEAMVRALKRKLDIKSPSRVTAVLGGFVGEGFAKGISDSKPKVTKASVDLFDVPKTVSSKLPAQAFAGLQPAGGGPTIVNQFNGQMGYTKDEVVDGIVVRQRRAQQKVRVPR